MNQWQVKTEIHRENLIKFLSGVEIPPKGLIVEWYDADSKRTLEQNKLLWVAAYQPIANHLSDYTGQLINTDMVHEICKDKFLEPLLVPRKDGSHKKYSGSTRKLNKKDFGEYLEKVWSWGATELGVQFDA